MLWDISLWRGSEWTGWKTVDLPEHLVADWAPMIGLLHGLPPLNRNTQDVIGWGNKSKGYIVADGYVKRQERPHVPINPTPWQVIWQLQSWPKIDMFVWMLCHGRILTFDHLQKLGYNRPSICLLCSNSEESAVHLFLGCSYAKQIWSALLYVLDPSAYNG